jgi:hypothetical protein
MRKTNEAGHKKEGVEGVQHTKKLNSFLCTPSVSNYLSLLPFDYDVSPFDLLKN